MKNALLLFALTLVSGIATAQSRHQFTLGAGVSSNLYKVKYDHLEEKVNFSPFVEVGYGYQIQKNIELGANLSLRNYRFSSSGFGFHSLYEQYCNIAGLEYGIFFKHRIYHHNKFSLGYRAGLLSTYYAMGKQTLIEKDWSGAVETTTSISNVKNIFQGQSRWNGGIKVGIDAQFNERWSLSMEYTQYLAGTWNLSAPQTWNGTYALVLRYRL